MTEGRMTEAGVNLKAGTLKLSFGVIGHFVPNEVFRRARRVGRFNRRLIRKHPNRVYRWWTWMVTFHRHLERFEAIGGVVE